MKIKDFDFKYITCFLSVFSLLIAATCVSNAAGKEDKSDAALTEPLIRISKISNTHTEGTYLSHNDAVIFRASQTSDNTFELTVGRPGDLITNMADLETGVLTAKIAKKAFIFTPTDIDLFSGLAPELYSALPESKKELRHNVMLLSLVAYYGRAPVGHIIKDGQVFD